MTSEKPIVWIVYTTLYRRGGPRFYQVAMTLAQEKNEELGTSAEVRCVAIESKKNFVAEIKGMGATTRKILELHFVGHAGMYGPMFGTVDLPEQFSPHEWTQLEIPFEENAKAFFHTCRSARWFAPFFARTFRKTTYGYHGYTVFSRAKEKYRFAPDWLSKDAPLYLFGCPGRKSHGLIGSLGKYLGWHGPEEIIRFDPAPNEHTPLDTSYDPVAELYNEVFDDIRVRRHEWGWLQRHLRAFSSSKERKLDLLDIGCGNGAMLQGLEKDLHRGVGVDVSGQMIRLAQARTEGSDRLFFHCIQGPKLPLPDNSVDVVTSFLSFRYLDWDPIMAEVIRVLRPGGRFLVIDMVNAPLRVWEWPRFIRSVVSSRIANRRERRFKESLANLVRDERWHHMLRYNPIRSDHEMRWYLESRFSGRKVEIINYGLANRILAFDSGSISANYIAPQSYP